MQKNSLFGELMAEFFGTFLLILGGDGVVANVGLAPRLASEGYDWNVIVWGWGLSVMVAVYVAGGVSGAHINPAVTFALAIKRGFPWSKLAPYWIAQIAGAFVGALGVFLVYRDGLVGAGMPNVWCTGPGSVMAAATWGAAGASQAVGPYSLVTALIAEIAGTMVLLLGIVGWGDSSAGNGWMGAFIVGMVVVMVGLTLGGPSGYAINPARDFGPRLLGLLVGTQGLFSGLYWLVAPIIGPLIGGPLGILLYDVFIMPYLPKP
ncbi:MAG: aquaporin family protein [Anaerolineales bacterium]|nr:aquaporin family protein [Anaerolineales bacterium]